MWFASAVGRAVVAVLLAAVAIADIAAQPAASVRITSPLGRTGVTGAVRIVAQVVAREPDGVVPVRFYVDGKLLGEDADGPP